jgi:L-fuculose-phosphate aldolase
MTLSTTALSHPDLRIDIINTCRHINAIGLNQGTSGNISVRAGQRILLTPSGLPYDDMVPEQIVEMDFDGTFYGSCRPTSEWRFHRDILASRPDVDTVIHTHSMFSTTLACLRRDIPALHYMIAVAGGDSIRCAEYATFGSQELSRVALAALADRKACLLANHGLIVLGSTLKKTVALAVEVETLAEQYWRALQCTAPVILDKPEMSKVLGLFETYGTQNAKDSGLIHGGMTAPRG